MITRRNFLGTAAIIGAAGTAILESKPVANAAAAGAPESTVVNSAWSGATGSAVANSASSGATGSTVGTYLASRLEQAGVRDYFVVPGDFNLILLDQILENPRLRMIGCCNELNAGYAADGYARSNGVAAMVVTYSVGGLSALNAVACAYAEDLPVIVVVGGINSDSEWQDKIIHHALGEVRYDYQREIYAHVTAGAFSVRQAADAPAMIDGAIDLALRRRKPVMLEIACNLASMPVPAPRPRRFGAAPASDTAALADAADHAADLLNKASRPVLVSGSKLRPPASREAFLKLADAAGYAVASVPAGKGMFPETHPAYVGIYWGPVSWPGVASVVESADAYLFAGTLLSDYATTGFTAMIDPKKLLLALPGEVRLPGATYAGVQLADFLGALAGRVRRNDASLVEFARGKMREEPPADAPGNALTIAEVSRQVHDALGRDTALLVETGDSWFHGLRMRLPEGCRFEIQFQAGSIGWSVPATLGYEMGFTTPTRVIAMIGDGSFQVTAQEVSTMIRYGMRPIIILVNNRGYIIEDAIHQGPYNKIKNWDYAGLMKDWTNDEGRGLGLHAKSAGELTAALTRAMTHDGPCLIEVAIDPQDCSVDMREWGTRVAAANGR
ncbi:MAG: thiamine pyrophosphate-binding protein, partial [Isosphaeraceae bacterium]